MKKVFWIILVLFGFGVTGIAQRSIQTETSFFIILEMEVFDRDISYLDPPLPNDPVAVKLYKQYFNPESYQAFRAFFLASDWSGATASDFETWQNYLHTNHVRLEKTLQLRDELNREFIICQYTVETIEYDFPSTAIFKKIGNSWKHISYINDPEALDLKRLGLLNSTYLESIPEDGPPRSLRNIQTTQTMAPVEKFDRSKLFSGVREVLKSRNVSDADLELSEKLFMDKAEVDMVKYIGQSYSLDIYNLMEELNKAVGFRLYRFVSTLKTN